MGLRLRTPPTGRNRNRPRLADRVEWVADTKGDGLGYDVVSFSPNGQKLLLEVKTTAAPKSTPFVMTRNELRVWRSEVAAYQVFRIFDFGDNTRFYRLKGEPDAIAQLRPALWEVRPGATRLRARLIESARSNRMQRCQ